MFVSPVQICCIFGLKVLFDDAMAEPWQSLLRLPYTIIRTSALDLAGSCT